MKRILLIATLIFVSCAAAPARDSNEVVSVVPEASTLSITSGKLRFEKKTTYCPVVSESAGAGDCMR
jgi:hypothetical protein